MNTLRNAAAIPAPGGSYSHAVEVPATARTLYVAGQIALAADGSIPEGIEAQTEMVWSNLEAILADAGMGVADLVKINTYVTSAELFAGMAKVRAKHLGAARPASTAVIVSALALPKLLVELEAVAAK